MTGNAHGKICYLVLPAESAEESAAFYTAIFEWTTRRHGDGTLAFDDPLGGVSGMWVTGRPPASNPGLEVHIMVRSAAGTEAAIVAAGGTIVQPADPGQGEIWGLFRDPYGNQLGYYEDRSLAGRE
ncbi:MAG: VOC family protein [Thermomicrobiales bacterium]